MLEEIIRCAKARGIPEESFLDSVQKKYAVYVQAGHLGSLRALQEITGIKPDLSESEEVVQERYSAYVQEGYLEGLKVLQEITGIKPAEGVLEKLVDFIVK